ncbi:hypothetical protein SBA5_290191 [Candidatus Sulfotelmatomonas gaucii]|uniref:Uncharacterized protein n=1 Tax=Candidatus Sulfuritelmatomonas gaucii TaxID=2043161 RepID=A0A2N9LAL0_9BACT|nr:hypothetical protein SBA5_290191 [Candidatus Sulfotelmatomonas gaucii]
MSLNQRSHTMPTSPWSPPNLFMTLWVHRSLNCSSGVIGDVFQSNPKAAAKMTNVAIIGHKILGFWVFLAQIHSHPLTHVAAR